MWMSKKFVYQVGDNKKNYTMMHGQTNIKTVKLSMANIDSLLPKCLNSHHCYHQRTVNLEMQGLLWMQWSKFVCG
jgi:predicted HNH restriction endonuclease